MTRKVLLFLLIWAFMVWAIPPHPVQAGDIVTDDPPPGSGEPSDPPGSGSGTQTGSAVNYCNASKPEYDPERCITFFEGLTLLATRWVVSLGQEMVRSFVYGVWIVARLALAGFRLLVEGTWLESLRTALLTNLMSFMPEVLRNISLGPTGVMYIAMALAGILLTIPLALGYGARLVKPDKVMIWGVVLVALFISGTAGYDLVGGLDTLRVELMKLMLGQQTSSSVSQLVLAPMQASEGDTEIALDNLLTMPVDFERNYFLDPEETEVSMRIAENGVFAGTVMNTVVEMRDSQARRREGAVQALIFAVLTGVGTSLIIIFMVGYLFLNLAALILILFLFAGLPLGFFEFGGMVLSGIVQKYVQVVVYSLGLALLMRASAELLRSILPNGFTDAGTVVEWLMLVGALVFATRTVAGATLSTLTSSLTVFPQAVRAGLGVPEGPSALQTVARVTTGALSGAAVSGGNVLGAVVGGAAALISGGGTATPAPITGQRWGKNGTVVEEEMDVLDSAPEMGDVFVSNGSVARQRTAPSYEDEWRDAPTVGVFSPPMTAEWISGWENATPSPAGQTAAMWGEGWDAKWEDLPKEAEQRTTEAVFKSEPRREPASVSVVKVETHSEPLQGAMRQAQILGSGMQPSQGRKVSGESTEDKG